MNATDIARRKYMKLMAEVEDLEEQVATLESKPRTAAQQQELLVLQERLAAARTELTRVSDGCGTPHAK